MSELLESGRRDPTGGGVGSTRLGYLLSQYPSANHTYLLREVRALRASGIDVRVVAIDGDTRPLSAVTGPEVEERASTYVVKARSAVEIISAHIATALTRPRGYARGIATALHLAGGDLKRVVYHLFYFGEAVVAGRRLSAEGCTHVHTHYATTVACIAARVFAFDLSATIHGSAEFIDPRAQRLREKIAACAFVRAISMYGRSQLMLASPIEQWRKFVVIRLGVDPDTFTPAPPRTRVLPFKLASVGQLQAAKGFPVLLTALATLVGQGRDITLTLVGGGSERGLLETLAADLGISERVKFTGALNQTAVRNVLAESDAFVLASFAEGIPVVLMEAMATELPCVSTQIAGIPELIRDGHDGLLVAPSDSTALADALTRLMDNDDERRQLGLNARKRVRLQYNLEDHVSELSALFARTLRRVHSPEVSRSLQ